MGSGSEVQQQQHLHNNRDHEERLNLTAMKSEAARLLTFARWLHNDKVSFVIKPKTHRKSQYFICAGRGKENSKGRILSHGKGR